MPCVTTPKTPRVKVSNLLLHTEGKEGTLARWRVALLYIHDFGVDLGPPSGAVTLRVKSMSFQIRKKGRRRDKRARGIIFPASRI